MQRALARLALLSLVFTTVGFAANPVRAPAAVRPASQWLRPLPGPVVRPFIAPRTRYGPGHRGVDLAAAPGSDVIAAGAGVVVFAGRIGPSSHVVVSHQPSGWRTGYSFLASVAVHRGQTVAAGATVGTSGGTSVGSAEGHDGTVLHFSLRIGERYVDPMILFGPLDLGAVVHLDRYNGGEARAGSGDVAPATSERASLLAGLRSRAGPPEVGSSGGGLSEGGISLLRADPRRLSAAEVGAALVRMAVVLAHERWR